MGLIIFLGIVAVVMLLILLKFTRTQEGTAQAIMTFGGLSRIVISWRGHKLDKNGDVVKGEDLSLLPGGLRFVGVRLVSTVYKYIFRWQDYELREGGVRELKFHEKEINYINLKPDVFAIKVDRAELRGILPGIGKAEPERIPVTAVFLWTAEVFNPEKTLFHSPPNWNENATTLLEALFTRWIGMQGLDYLIALKGQLQLSEGNIQLWDKFKDDQLFKRFQSWGFRTIEDGNGIALGSLELPKDIEEAAEVQRKRELEAKGVIAATAGLVLQTMGLSRGKNQEEMAAVIAAEPADSALRKEFMGQTIDLVKRDQAAKVGALSDIRVQGAGSGVEQVLYNFAAILRGHGPTPEKAEGPVQEEKTGAQKKGAEKEKDSFDVVLTAIGNKEHEVINVVRNTIPRRTFPEAMDLVRAAAVSPQIIEEGLKKEKAEALKKKLEAAGATVELR